MDLENQTGAAPVAADSAPSMPAPEAPQPSLRESLEAVYDKHHQPRADDGKFAGREGEEPATEAPAEQAVEPDAAAAETTDQPEEQASEPETPAIDAPHSWSADMKAQWAKLPPDVQKYVHERESEAHKAISQQGAMVKAFQPIGQMINDFRDDFAKQNVSPAQGISYLLDMNRQFVANPESVLLRLADQAGIDLAQLAAQPPRSPDVTAVERRLDALQAERETEKRTRAEAEMAEAQQALDAFGKGKPHFGETEVQHLMGLLMQSGQASDLETAYELATHAIPSIRGRIQADQRKAEEAKRRAEAEKAAAAAKKAAAINVRSSGNGASPAAPASLRESLEQAYDRAIAH